MMIEADIFLMRALPATRNLLLICFLEQGLGIEELKLPKGMKRND